MFYDCATNKINIFDIINNQNGTEDENKEENIESVEQDNEFKNNENCKILRNDNLKFLPQMEIKFEGQFKIDNNMINNFKNEIKKLVGNDNISLVEINKGSFKVIITLQFIYKKILESMRENPTVENILNFQKK